MEILLLWTSVRGKSKRVEQTYDVLLYNLVSWTPNHYYLLVTPMPLHCSIVQINFVIFSTTDHYLPLLSYVKLDTHHDLIWTVIMDCDHGL